MEESYFKRVRKEMHLSQNELADRMGITRGALVNLEDGKTEIVTGSVLKFCRATGISLVDVMEELFPEYCGQTLTDETHYEELHRQTVAEYEDRLNAKNEEIRRQRELVQAQQQTIEAKDKVIEMLEQQSRKI